MDWWRVEQATGLLGSARHDIHFGLLTATTGNVWGAKLKPTDCMPYYKEEPPTLEALEAKIKLSFNT